MEPSRRRFMLLKAAHYARFNIQWLNSKNRSTLLSLISSLKRRASNMHVRLFVVLVNISLIGY